MGSGNTSGDKVHVETIVSRKMFGALVDRGKQCVDRALLTIGSDQSAI